MNIDQLKSLVAQGESHTLEFKKSTASLRAAFESLCGFLNCDGGTVLIGVTDEGAIVGQEITDKTQQLISSEISRLEPPASVEISYVPLQKSDLKVIVLIVQAGPHKPYVCDGRPYLREQAVTKRMPQQFYDRLVSQRMQINFSWERMTAFGYSVDDLDHNLLRNIIRTAVEIKRLPEMAVHQDLPTVLEALELSIDGHLTNAAIVLFGKKINMDYAQCQLQLARFRGINRDEFIDIDQAYGNTFELMEKSMGFVRKHLPVAAKIVSGQLQRLETLLIPFDAIREVLYNAFCHRDYNIHGGSIGLAIYDDRMEVFSHGGLPSGVTIEKIKEGYSKRRNPIIAEVFFRANLIEKWGRGIQKIISSCLAADDPEPEFFADTLEFKVIFRFPTVLAPPSINMKEVENISSNLTRRQQSIINLLAEAGEMMPSEIMNKLSDPLPERTLRRELMALKALNLIGSKGHTNIKTWYLLEKANHN